MEWCFRDFLGVGFWCFIWCCVFYLFCFCMVFAMKTSGYFEFTSLADVYKRSAGEHIIKASPMGRK